MVACNSLSAFLDAGFVSKREKTRRLVLSSETWLAVFEVHLKCFEYSKPKPIRQVLLSLARLLSSQVQENERRVFLMRICDAVIPSIIVGEPRSRLKASLVALEVLIRKKAISPLHLISMARVCLLNHHYKWRHVLGEDYSINFSQFTSEGQLDDATAAAVLVQGLLIQSRNTDIASLAGSLIALLLERIQADAVAQQHLTMNNQCLSSIWTIPARRVMLQNLDFLDQLSNHILQPLFTVDRNGFESLIDKLPVKSLIIGDMADVPSEEFILLFSVLQTGKKTGLVDEDRKLYVTVYFGRPAN